MKKILITGGAGFLGSHLCKKLHDQGHHIICLDNYFTGSESNIKTLIGKPRFEAITHDITKPITVDADQIYNLACPASPIHYQYNPIKTIKTSVQGTINMLGIAKRTNATFFQASTSEIYGDPTVHPQTEDYWGNVNTIGPRSCYDEGKRCAETLCFDYHREHQVNIKIVRIFNTYGPHMAINDGRVVSNFITQALQNENITIYGDGSQTRSFCYVDDLVEGLISFMNTPNSITGPINMGNPHAFTMLELAEKILHLIPSSTSQIIFKPLPQDDPKQRQPDISKAKKHLSWTPSVQLEDGLKKTIQYFKTALNQS